MILRQGFTQLQTYLLAIAQGAIIMAFLFSAAWLSKRYNNKLLFAFVSIPNCEALRENTYVIYTDLYNSKHCWDHSLLE